MKFLQYKEFVCSSSELCTEISASLLLSVGELLSVLYWRVVCFLKRKSKSGRVSLHCLYSTGPTAERNKAISSFYSDMAITYTFHLLGFLCFISLHLSRYWNIFLTVCQYIFGGCGRHCFILVSAVNILVGLCQGLWPVCLFIKNINLVVGLAIALCNIQFLQFHIILIFFFTYAGSLFISSLKPESSVKATIPTKTKFWIFWRSRKWVADWQQVCFEMWILKS